MDSEIGLKVVVSAWNYLKDNPDFYSEVAEDLKDMGYRVWSWHDENGKDGIQISEENSFKKIINLYDIFVIPIEYVVKTPFYDISILTNEAEQKLFQSIIVKFCMVNRDAYLYEDKPMVDRTFMLKHSFVKVGSKSYYFYNKGRNYELFEDEIDYLFHGEDNSEDYLMMKFEATANMSNLPSSAQMALKNIIAGLKV